MQAWTHVKVINEELELFGHGGVCQGVPFKYEPGADVGEEVDTEAEYVEVKMDATGEVHAFKVNDLQALA